ncbi:uroporphyrinogen-III synthase [Thioalkalivibrio sp. ALMg11]|uniref:uroporphyrinogen-III synthase n=1 Tax=Thioalkalivibrio sp. ALMg11 TaxID=1158165 RepID=UPI0003806504|nr:uroporphyrinogen-III synthase [Thioalkalivibrio sp. ALMg11]
MTASANDNTVVEEARGPLAGLGILVTRPAAQAEPFCTALTAEGASVIRFPVLEILAPSDPTNLREVLDRLEDFDIAVFISPNAVQRVLNLALAERTWPASTKIAAIGNRTAQELKGFGRPADILPPRRFDSEALLAQEAMQDVAGKRVVIFRGDGGRELLGDTLKDRGAEVTFAEAYRRGRPEGDTGELMYAFSRGQIGVITITSGEGLRNLYEMVGKLGRMWLRKTPLVVGSERIAEIAQELGFKAAVETAEDPTDAAMLAAVHRLADQLRAHGS